jgi:hypothetical protein
VRPGGSWSLLQTAVPPGAAVSASPQAAHDPLDSVVVNSPIPDPLIPFVQGFFQQPGWLIGLEFILGGAAACWTFWYLWTRRIWMFGWFRRAPRGAQVAFVGANLALLLAAVGSAGYSYNYMMHDNDFCKGCHIFVPSGQAWVKPDTGHYLLVNALEGKHDTLSCHACHPFELQAQTKEMLMWIADRPEDVPPHGRVPQAICEQCHVQGEARETWQRIAATAGHSVHLAQDTTHAGGRIQCLTCHARSAHRFEARDSTCAMSGCHETNSIRLGKMASQTNTHCTLCHQFGAEHAEGVVADSASTLMVPGGKQCLACHGMQQLTAAFDFTRDPHEAKCGSCHNPHSQTRPAGADSTCAACHSDWRDVPFHTGAIHRGSVRPNACTACHQPHAARVDASDCTGCHQEMREARSAPRGLLPPVPFDTAAALRTSAIELPEREPRGKGDAPVIDDPPWVVDTFSHPRHQRLPCLTCHDPRSNNRLTFDPGRGCQICHHQAAERSTCTSCHDAAELAARPEATVTVAVATTPPRARAVPFDHTPHAARSCVSCHTTPVTLAPPPAVATCSACHDDHAAARDCVACHAAAAPFSAHAPPANAHRNCVACHAGAIVAELSPTRPLCLTCHQTEREHKPGRECTTCHLQATPEEYRPRLRESASR